MIATTSFMNCARFLKIAPAALFLQTLFAIPAHALPVQLFNTGVNASGVKLPTYSVDPHWETVAGPGIFVPSPAYVVAGSPLYAFTPKSQWIWVASSGRAAIKTPYTFRLSFDLTGLDPDTAILSGTWGVDNLAQMLLNGNTPMGTGTFSFTSVGAQTFNPLRPFSITDGFIEGINTLEIKAIDDGNPGAFNVSSLVASADVEPPVLTHVSEPPIIALFCSALLLTFRRISRRQAARSLRWMPI